NLKGLADALATRQKAAGLDPVGLDPKYPGLREVFREGDPLADSLRQPIDFFSPDTFSYTVLEIGTDGRTLSISSYGVDSYGKHTSLQPSASRPARESLGFKVDADAPADAAEYRAFGVGCPGTYGTPGLSAQPGSLPWIGELFTLRLTNLGQSPFL